MKKILIGFLQVISFMIIYDVVLYFCTFFLTFIYELLLNVPIINNWLSIIYVYESTFYTFLPIMCGSLIITIISFIFKKTGIYLGSAIIIFMLLSFSIISQLISTISTYGIISWDTANIVWYDIILCVILTLGIISSLNYDISINKKEEIIVKDIKYYNNEFKERFSKYNNPLTGKKIETVQEYFEAVDIQSSGKSELTNKTLSLEQINEFVKNKYGNIIIPSTGYNVSNVEDYLQAIDEVQNK